MIHKKIELREERDFGQKFNAVFTFVQSNFKTLFKIIGFTAGPLAIIGGMFFGIFYSEVLGNIPGGSVETLNTAGMFGELGLSYLILILASLWMMIALYAYMAEYEHGNEHITIEAVWRRGKSKIWPAIGFVALMLVGFSMMGAIVGFLASDSPGLMVLLVLLLLVVLFYLTMVLSMVLPCMVIDGYGLFESIGRSFALIKGKWWSTFGLLFVMGIIASFASVIFAIPFYIALFMKMLLQTGDAGTVMTAAGASILSLGSFLMQMLPLLAIGFQYFNLSERKEGTGLLKKIDQLGKPVDNADEGEY